MKKALLILTGIILVLFASAQFYEPVQNRETEMGNYTIQITAPQAAGYAIIGNLEGPNGMEIEFSMSDSVSGIEHIYRVRIHKTGQEVIWPE